MKLQYRSNKIQIGYTGRSQDINNRPETYCEEVGRRWRTGNIHDNAVDRLTLKPRNYRPIRKTCCNLQTKSLKEEMKTLVFSRFTKISCMRVVEWSLAPRKP